MRNVIMLVIAVICSISVALATPKTNNHEFTYQFDYNSPPIETYITENVCSNVGDVTDHIKVMVDRGESDRQIKDRLKKAVLANLNDKTGVTVFHMVMMEGFMDRVRELKQTDFYRELAKGHESVPDKVIFAAWADATCQASIGKTIKEIRVIRVHKGVAF